MSTRRLIIAALVEQRWIGGTCLNVGCIPAKELLETAHVYRTVSEAASFGINAGEPQVDWSITQQRKQAVVDELVGGVTIAAGSETRTIPGFDVDGSIVMTSDEVLSMPAVPGTAIETGGGAIGCEFASMMADLGSQVTVLEALPKILPGLDKDVAQVVERSFKKRNIDVRTGVNVTGHEPSDGGTVVNIEGADSIKTDVVVVSVGRKPATADLGLEGTGVQLDERGFVVVDDVCRTGEQGVWAVGDCIDTPQLAHVGFAEAIVAITDSLGEQAVPIDYGRVPWGIYCKP